MKKRFTRILFLIVLSTICNFTSRAQQVIFGDPFTYNQVAPVPGWTAVNNVGSPVQWECNFASAIGGYCFVDYAATNTTKIIGITDGYMPNLPNATCSGNNNLSNYFIYSPVFSLAMQTHAVLQFDALFRKETIGGISEGAYAEVSTDNGATWSRIYALTGDSSGFHTHYTDLTPYCGQPTVRIGFRYSDSGQLRKGLMLDNVKVYVPAAKDMSLTAISPGEKLLSYVVQNTPTWLSGKVVNRGTDTVTTFAVQYMQDGGVTKTHTVAGISLAPLASYSFTHSIPDTVTGVSEYAVKMWVAQSGDMNAANDTLKTKLYGAAFIPDKKLVIEEGTGTWNMYGPRGIVYLDSFRNDETICKISVHNTDVMAVSGYGDYLYNLNYNYIPYFLLDRHKNVPYQLYFDTIAHYKQHFGFAGIAATCSISGNTLTVNTIVTPAVDLTGDIRMVVILTEDNVTGTTADYNQKNGYVNGLIGPMGGYETKPDPVPAADMHYNYVARGIYPSSEGAAGVYSYTMNYNSNNLQTITATIDPAWNVGRMRGVAMLIDYKDTTVLNAQTFIPYQLGIKENIATGFGAIVYPNPATDEAKLYFELGETGTLQIMLMDISGRLLWQHQGRFTRGKNVLQLPVDKLAGGIYLTTMIGAGGRQTVKVQVTGR